MRRRYPLLPLPLLVALTLPLFGGHNHEDTNQTAIASRATTVRMGKPTVDATVDGLRFQVWLMTQAQHEKMMEGQAGQPVTGTERRTDELTPGTARGTMDVNQAMLDSMTADTHHIVLDLTDVAAGKAVSGATARVMVTFPSARNTSVDLRPVLSRLDGALALDEKGEYRFIVAVSVGGFSTTTQFPYALK
jgi:hypothetical protein